MGDQRAHPHYTVVTNRRYLTETSLKPPRTHATVGSRHRAHGGDTSRTRSMDPRSWRPRQLSTSTVRTNEAYARRSSSCLNFCRLRSPLSRAGQLRGLRRESRARDRLALGIRRPARGTVLHGKTVCRHHACNCPDRPVAAAHGGDLPGHQARLSRGGFTWTTTRRPSWATIPDVQVPQHATGPPRVFGPDRLSGSSPFTQGPTRSTHHPSGADVAQDFAGRAAATVQHRAR